MYMQQLRTGKKISVIIKALSQDCRAMEPNQYLLKVILHVEVQVAKEGQEFNLHHYD